MSNGVLIGVACGLMCGLVAGVRNVPDNVLQEVLAYVIGDGLAVGLGYWFFVAFLQGISSGVILDERLRITPNQGIRLSVRNGLFVGLIGACMSGVFAFLAVLLRDMLSNSPLVISSNYVGDALLAL
jgi:hypothetical protein